MMVAGDGALLLDVGSVEVGERNDSIFISNIVKTRGGVGARR